MKSALRLTCIVSQQERMFPVTMLSLVLAQVNLGFFTGLLIIHGEKSPGANPLTKVK